MWRSGKSCRGHVVDVIHGVRDVGTGCLRGWLLDANRSLAPTLLNQLLCSLSRRSLGDFLVSSRVREGSRAAAAQGKSEPYKSRHRFRSKDASVHR